MIRQRSTGLQMYWCTSLCTLLWYTLLYKRTLRYNNSTRVLQACVAAKHLCLSNIVSCCPLFVHWKMDSPLAKASLILARMLTWCTLWVNTEHVRLWSCKSREVDCISFDDIIVYKCYTWMWHIMDLSTRMNLLFVEWDAWAQQKE
jgi:hypothetical protein